MERVPSAWCSLSCEPDVASMVMRNNSEVVLLEESPGIGEAGLPRLSFVRSQRFPGEGQELRQPVDHGAVFWEVVISGVSSASNVYALWLVKCDEDKHDWGKGVERRRGEIIYLCFRSG